jgi:hypothetical protein
MDSLWVKMFQVHLSLIMCFVLGEISKLLLQL